MKHSITEQLTLALGEYRFRFHSEDEQLGETRLRYWHPNNRETEQDQLEKAIEPILIENGRESLLVCAIYDEDRGTILSIYFKK